MKKLLIPITIIIILILLGFGVFFIYRKTRPQTPISTVRTEVNYQTLISKNNFEVKGITKQSPDGNYTVFETAEDSALKNATLWVADKYGTLTKIAVNDQPETFFSAIAWRNDSKAFAYLKIYPSEIITVDLNKNFLRTKFITKIDKKDNNLLNPSWGYNGKGFLNWTDADSIEFEDNFAIPNRIVSMDFNSLKTRFRENSLKIQSANDNFYSQRDPIWQDNIFGKCLNQTFRSAGCAVATLSSAFSNLGFKFTPTTLNDSFIKNDLGYLNGCDVKWYMAPFVADGIIFKGAYDNVDEFKRMDYELSLGSQVILGFDKVPYTGIPHWVLVKEKVGDKYIISDPWDFDSGTKTLDDLGGSFDHMVVYSKVSI